MLFATLILSVFFIVRESETDQNSLEFQRANGINATIDGYLPRCPGCVVFGRDPLIVYGKFHLPRDKWHLLTRDRTRPEPIFLVSLCDYGCENYADRDLWYQFCRFGKNVFTPNGCKLMDTRPKFSMEDCYCEDTEPMLWFAVIKPSYFKETNMVISAVWNGEYRERPRFFPHRSYNTIYLRDLFARGHIVRPRQRSTNRSKSWAADLLLELTSIVLAFGTVAFFMS
ncbi:uncharacterized protein LOC131933213 [Physella acuta]|uniref:uncharacterized protein LOC131933213 n=1 Tax=Physella acuta TaxID=109671 RepID=UPI0027DCEA61|nr:uncharacterized protein LOC131933213 [Physella acuta]